MRSGDEIRIFPLGDAALTVEFGRTISKDLNRKAIAIGEHFQKKPFEGFVEAVPAYASTAIFYDPFVVKNTRPEAATAFEVVRTLVSEIEASIDAEAGPMGSVVEIQVVFHGPDLDDVATFAALPKTDVIDIFLARNYRVYMLGFLPGFTYMAEVDERIAIPRKTSPRIVVPKGSIGIAGKQTGVYSLPSPGGWQLIGRTGVEMFSHDADPPTLVQPGDEVRFVAV
jgi:inhibitor of KinA